MRSFENIDFSCFTPVNFLWPNFVEKLGVNKSKIAIQQAIDLQNMQGNISTLPVLLYETCGIALVDIQHFYSQTGLPCRNSKNLLILSIRDYQLQLLHEV